jgi:co-chaperonin GroES (HSP10)
MATVQALGSTVVLKQHSKETTVGSLGIIVASKFADEKTIGDVISVGPSYDGNLYAEEPVLKAGDTVVFRNAQRTRIGDEDYLFVNQDDVLSIIRD